MKRLSPQSVALALAAPLTAAAFGLGISSLTLVVTDHNPLTVFRAMWTYGTDVNSLIEMVNLAVVYYLAALAVAITFKAGLFNIGVEGQFLAGARELFRVRAAACLHALRAADGADSLRHHRRSRRGDDDASRLRALAHLRARRAAGGSRAGELGRELRARVGAAARGVQPPHDRRRPRRAIRHRTWPSWAGAHRRPSPPYEN